jgi:hypothetical protein
MVDVNSNQILLRALSINHYCTRRMIGSTKQFLSRGLETGFLTAPGAKCVVFPFFFADSPKSLLGTRWFDRCECNVSYSAIRSRGQRMGRFDDGRGRRLRKSMAMGKVLRVHEEERDLHPTVGRFRSRY